MLFSVIMPVIRCTILNVQMMATRVKISLVALKISFILKSWHSQYFGLNQLSTVFNRTFWFIALVEDSFHCFITFYMEIAPWLDYLLNSALILFQVSWITDDDASYLDSFVGDSLEILSFVILLSKVYLDAFMYRCHSALISYIFGNFVLCLFANDWGDPKWSIVEFLILSSL